ncbi:MAG: DUF192 domain-containing protein [Candidatus Sungbacteria bacterium]|uniref:DUF192 domain-containing protein n=1 Tax=Candidatus Sungiibacteriota bacterium TaxID=2750080 RepID=A0A932YWS4_9BACT|nr:DUF192 domain-containing protein [Candidatus Sungbacteria bacterium]
MRERLLPSNPWPLLLVVGLLVLLIGIRSIRPESSPGEERRATAYFGSTAFYLDIADTPALREQGLAGRPALPRNGGMIFLFDYPDRHVFWMKGMQFPIDIFWIRGDTIVAIQERAEPPKPGATVEILEHFVPSGPADIVIETQAGVAREFGVRPGQRVRILLP